ncbi:MAG TPA: hypothetical protein VIF57_30500 [Polyangia bacterium]|jgi:hypothetical protein
MLLLLLRLLTLPAPALPAVAVMDSKARPAAALDANALRAARNDLAMIEAGPHRIRAMLPAAADRAIYTGCVAQRLAEAQVHVAIARDEMQHLTGGPPAPPPAEQNHARDRIALLAQRTRDVERDALRCVDQDDSSISATKSETTVPLMVMPRPDPTLPPPPAYPCPSGGACLVIPEP